VLAVVAPFLLCVVLVPFRRGFANIDAALLLVLLVVAVAAAGYRVAGGLAALSSAIWFDFFLTRPYQRLTISSRSDIETAALLLAVGLAVSEIAHWGRQRAALASQQAGYIEGIQATAEVVAAGSSSPSALIEKICEQMTTVLGLRRCRFDYGMALGHPRLQPDGTVVWNHQAWDIDAQGLPTQMDTELPAESGGRFMGRFLLTAGPDTRPTHSQRLVAVALASQAGAALSDYDSRRREAP
jgi:hypothetical protein